MIYLVGAILFLVALLFIGYPLFRPDEVWENEYAEQHDVASREVALRSMIDELELDFEMGNIPEEEYRELDSKYRHELGDICKAKPHGQLPANESRKQDSF